MAGFIRMYIYVFFFSFLQHIGPSALAGIATVILIFPLNGYIAKKRSKLQVLTHFHPSTFSPPPHLARGVSVRPQHHSSNSG